MPSSPWQADWWSSIAMLERDVWRAVEAQHRVATMRLADTLAEQQLLEQLLEDSKPSMPAGTEHLHYLLATPFRYRSTHPSRFRMPTEPGIWYGAETVRTACIETAYWRWRFLVDSDGLREQEVITEHTLFAAVVRGMALDLGRPPWSSRQARWTDPDDYATCHALARAARDRGVQWIRYVSARDADGHCAAVFESTCLTMGSMTRQQTWICQASRTRAIVRPKDDAGAPFELVFDPRRVTASAAPRAVATVRRARTRAR